MVVSPAMAQRTALRIVVAVLSLCATAHPAFADGVFENTDGYLSVLIGLLVLGLIAITVVVVIARGAINGLGRVTDAARQRRAAREATPQVPAARVVDPDGKDRDAERDRA
jgi:hypothetical protein